MLFSDSPLKLLTGHERDATRENVGTAVGSILDGLTAAKKWITPFGTKLVECSSSTQLTHMSPEHSSIGCENLNLRNFPIGRCGQIPKFYS
jgi:hypothetical protein